jgi:acyl-CoA synthetase (AMP-forming)/AMP-acid ligase II
MPVQTITEADNLRQHGHLRPEHPAIIFGDRVTSYGELDRRASQVANGLLALQLTRPGRVAILAKNSSDFFELLFGILKAGLTVLPVNWRLAPPEIEFILKDAEVEAVFVGEEFAILVPGLRQQCPALAHVFVIEGVSSRETPHHEKSFATWRDARSDVDPDVPADPEDIMILFYTSGTTGDPKGVQISHRSSKQMRAMEVQAGEDWMQYTSADVAIVALPNFHLSGTSWALQWLARGATCVVQEQVDAEAFLLAIPRYRVTHLFAVPTVIDMMLSSQALAGLDLSSLRVVYYGAAPMPPTLLQRALAALRCSFVQIYGMTESNGAVCYLTPTDHTAGDEQLLKSCGRPLPAIDLRILNAQGQEAAPGEVGEICIRSPSLMSGYWRRESLCEGLFHGDHFRTGDAGYRNRDGYLFLVDRIKDMIISGGENIYPAEIERALLQHPGVGDAAVVGVPDPRWGESVVAVVVRRTADLSERAITDWVRERIAAYKAPKRVLFVDALPRNASGKVLKRVLRQQLQQQ